MLQRECLNGTTHFQFLNNDFFFSPLQLLSLLLLNCHFQEVQRIDKILQGSFSLFLI